ncbi:MAG TPA: SH3 domain-containing protein [Thermoanaerobaculia bacterium]|nr:SH3 domain-containing protein [Thermoanaerobaculia bacterium]
MRRSTILLLLLFGCGRAKAPRPAASATRAPATATHAVATTATEPAAAVTPVRGRKIQPVDEASQDPSFVAYRAQLLDAVRRHDRDALLGLIDPKIRTGFDGGGGTKDFIDDWKLDSPDSKLWAELETILTHGGAFSVDEGKRSFWAPYVFSGTPDDVDAFESVIVVGAAVPLYDKPSTKSKAIATLEHDVLTGVEGDEVKGWDQVKTDDGRTGWVEEREVRSPIDYRAGFAKVKGAWKMNTLVAGD